MLGRAHRHDARTEIAPERLHPRNTLGIGVFGRQDRDAILEEIRAGMLDAVLLRARKRVGRNVSHAWRQPTGHAGHDVPLGAPGVGEDRSRPAVRRGADNAVRDVIDRRADHNQFGPGDRLAQIGAEGVDGSALDRAGQRSRVAPAADHARRQSARLRGQTHRPANQTDADDGDLLEPHGEDYKSPRDIVDTLPPSPTALRCRKEFGQD